MYFDIEKLKVNGKYIQILGDFIIKEEVCNLNCDYCLFEDAKLKDKHYLERVDGKLNYRLDMVQDLCYQDGYKLKEEVDRGIETYNKNFDAPIIKFSGGEVLLVKNLEQLLEEQSKNYEVVQVLTNGTLFNPKMVDRLKGIPNINIQFSIDGHTLDMNYNRVKTESMNKLLIDNFDMLVKNGITTEAYSVISIKNIDKLTQFAEYLKDRYGDKVHFTFFPVRHGAAKNFLPDKDELSGLNRLIERYDDFKSILPPLAYILEMQDYMITGKRKSRCFVPLVMFQNFDDGLITPCPNCWTIKLGNLLDDTQNVINSIGKGSGYNLMTNCPPVAPFCVKCFADYHLFNLYFNNVITLEEMSRTRPLLQGPRVQARMKQFKEIFEESLKGTEDLRQHERQH